MKILKKQLLSTLFFTSLMSAPFCATAINHNEAIEVQEEQIVAIKTPWYKKSYVVAPLMYVTFLVAFVALLHYTKSLDKPFIDYLHQWETQQFAKIKDDLQHSIHDLTIKISCLPEGQEKDAFLNQLEYLKKIDTAPFYRITLKRFVK